MGRQASAALPKAENETIFAILIAACVSHLLNDTIQSLIPAIYPVLKDSFQLNFTQIGLITLTFQITASMLQPIVGLYTDHRPQPFSLAVLGQLIDLTNIQFVFQLCGFLPLLGLLAAFLPDVERKRAT